MTWRKEDANNKGGASTSKAPRGPVAPVQEPQEGLDAEGEPTMSVFQAMGIGAGEGLWGTEHERFSYDVERQLMLECGIYPEKQWHLWRRIIFRDTEAM